MCVPPRACSRAVLAARAVLCCACCGVRSDLRRQLELARQTEEELAKRNNVYQKTIKSLVRHRWWCMRASVCACVCVCVCVV